MTPCLLVPFPASNKRLSAGYRVCKAKRERRQCPGDKKFQEVRSQTFPLKSQAQIFGFFFFFKVVYFKHRHLLGFLLFITGRPSAAAKAQRYLSKLMSVPTTGTVADCRHSSVLWFVLLWKWQRLLCFLKRVADLHLYYLWPDTKTGFFCCYCC